MVGFFGAFLNLFWNFGSLFSFSEATGSNPIGSTATGSNPIG